MKKQKLTLSVDMELIRQAHEQGVNISRLLEDVLRSYLQGGSQQQPDQSPKELDLKSLFPEECIRKLQSLNFKIDNETLKEIIQDCLQKVIVELELYDPVQLRYPTTTTREYA